MANCSNAEKDATHLLRSRSAFSYLLWTYKKIKKLLVVSACGSMKVKHIVNYQFKGIAMKKRIIFRIINDY
jgi:hypothetical protein